MADKGAPSAQLRTHCVELVVSLYAADISWLSKLRVDRLYMYNKGPSEPPWHQYAFSAKQGTRYTRLPNVGKCDGTYLYHIVDRWDELADWTVFLPDNAPLKLGPSTIEDVAVPGTCCKVPWVCRVRDWGPDGRIMWHAFTNRPDRNGTTWAERFSSGKIQRAELSFTDWNDKFIGCCLQDWPGYVPGALFGASREAIRANGRPFYEALYKEMSRSVEPEEEHYMERLWLAVLTGNTHVARDSA